MNNPIRTPWNQVIQGFRCVSFLCLVFLVMVAGILSAMSEDTLQTRQFRVNETLIPGKTPDDIRKSLESKGVDFKTPGSSAFMEGGKLFVKNTVPNLNKIEELVRGDLPVMVALQMDCVQMSQAEYGEVFGKDVYTNVSLSKSILEKLRNSLARNRSEWLYTVGGMAVSGEACVIKSGRDAYYSTQYGYSQNRMIPGGVLPRHTGVSLQCHPVVLKDRPLVSVTLMSENSDFRMRSMVTQEIEKKHGSLQQFEPEVQKLTTRLVMDLGGTCLVSMQSKGRREEGRKNDSEKLTLLLLTVDQDRQSRKDSQ